MPDAAPAPTGWLAIVAGPIGNLEDVSHRAQRLLAEADAVACEDTRRARILLDRYRIKARTFAYHAHNEHRLTAGLVDRVLAGEKLALLTDAGTPCLSDPGFLLVREALARGLEPEVIPGPSALLVALVACGFPVTSFAFAGFLPPKGQKRRTRLAELAAANDTFFLYESPFRIGKLLADLVAAIGPDVQVALLRELTKLHEQRLRGTAAELLAQYGEREWKGEFTVAVHLPKGSGAASAVRGDLQG